MSEHPLVIAARELAETLLAPAAAQVDADGVPRSHLRAIADAGLLGVSLPVEVGGGGASTAVFRDVAELLAGADAATWFVQAQHHGPARMLAANPSPAAQRYLAKLASGELVAGFAFSHLRKFPERPVTASRVAGGWRFDGVAPWYTGWGVNDVCFLAGVSDDGEVVFAIVPAAEGAGLSVQAWLRTAALEAAHTVVLRVDGLVATDDDIALVQPHADWVAGDVANANANPAIFGIGASAVALLRSTGQTRGEADTTAAASVFGERLADVRARAYALADQAPVDIPPGDAMDARLAVRAEALELLIAITSGLVAANAGQAMSRTAPAQRKAREALFMLVQAQTDRARAITMRHWTATASGRP